MRDALRIEEDRGLPAGLAAVLLAVFVSVLLARFEDWAAIVDLLITAAAAGLVLAPVAVREPRPGPPPGWLSAMLVAGFALAASALLSLADVLGANVDELHSSTIVWVSVLLAAGFAVLALRFDSAICTLLAAAAAVAAVLAAVDWVFSPEGAATFRYVLLVEALVLLAAGVALHGRRGRHGVVLVALAGLAALGIAATFVGLLFDPFGIGETRGVSRGWELAVLAFGLALAAFAALTREPGPGYVAAALLSAFVALTTLGAEARFVGWPLVLLLATAAALAAVLRPAPAPRRARR